MIAFPNAKINLGLNVVSKRNDGFHNIETVLCPIGLCDALEIIPATNQNHSLFTHSGMPIPIDGNANLCLRAFELLRKEFDLPAINIHLHKNIPPGSGLGGGSSNAAFTLFMVNETFSLNQDLDTLKQMAATLGSDCPFFIENQPRLATGRGERLEPINNPLKGLHLLLIKTSIHISTSNAYAGINPAIPPKSVAQIVAQPIETWRHELKNDFETHVFKRFPVLNKIKQDLYNHGAVYASMSGSGSAIYGLFKTSPRINHSLLPSGSFVWQQMPV